MAHPIIRPDWWLPERAASEASLYFNRRSFLRTVGLGVGATSIWGCESTFTPAEPDNRDTSCDAAPPTNPLQTICPSPTADLYPASGNPRYRVTDRPHTAESFAITHNNYYEFIGRPGNVNFIWDLIGPFQVRPWTVELSGEIENPGIYDVADLEREFGLEQRVYRHRCVERWSMAVPWTGYPLSKLIEKASPLSSAAYLKFTAFNQPDAAVGQATQPWYPWPFVEALRMDEALNELSFVATGLFGKPLPKQNGAPLRLAVPWKYGFKSVKAFVKIEFVQEQPNTFWTEFGPDEFGFLSNVNPDVPHPRWSQQEELMLGEFDPRPTLVYNGYGSTVGDLYDPETLTFLS